MKPVSLQSVADEMLALSDDSTVNINRKTGELVAVSEEEARIIEEEDDEFIPDWQKEMLPGIKVVLESADFVALPDKYAIHEYAVMEHFCLSLSNAGLQDELLDTIRGRGAFRRFKDAIYDMGIQDDWYRFRDTALKRIAADFLDREGIAWADDEAG